MQISAATPSKAAWKTTQAPDYLELYKSAKSEAQAIDGTDADSDQRDNFVQLSDDASVPGAYVQLWGAEKENAEVILNGHSYVEKTGDDPDKLTHIQKDRHMVLRSVLGGEAITATDSLSQSVGEEISANGRIYDNDVWSSSDYSYMLIGVENGSVLGENAGHTSLLESVDGNIAEYKKAVADLEG